jgi:hypothetical protein
MFFVSSTTTPTFEFEPLPEIHVEVLNLDDLPGELERVRLVRQDVQSVFLCQTGASFFERRD